MLRQIHFLLTLNCNFECDHCFLNCSPRASGTFTLDRLKDALAQIAKVQTIDWVYFEGGEPFLFYPLMVKGIELARAQGLKTGIVTNGYWATTERDAEIWLAPLAELDVGDLSISDDEFHYGSSTDNPAKNALTAAEKLAIPAGMIRVDKPEMSLPDGQSEETDGQTITGSTMFRGRAVDTLTATLPRREARRFAECPYEDLESPRRVHLDPFGNLHLCQGLVMGNIFETPLERIVANYRAVTHPIARFLAAGGPAALADASDVVTDETYVDACHFCYSLRLALLDRFPKHLAPKQVYGK